eukprot:CAMPEP_0177233634 /NCGR_PEP_ID=MMETSP0367-20130122/43970_1 /TAXON_ID=447022 ORGANISM="Scrippsiella hangoei-like, Strain SHHI-4" /NCGR_SAMPLE_ID=MMETSP0367 /ASSEMBLY_ACC=CAM_ASM_000362 /LENGTH=103 /DNA_ID=CAMNT_0018684379 /DNA_START=61 /DNA_END=372 /DNA_ORIENTATION=+
MSSLRHLDIILLVLAIVCATAASKYLEKLEHGLEYHSLQQSCQRFGLLDKEGVGSEALGLRHGSHLGCLCLAAGAFGGFASTQVRGHTASRPWGVAHILFMLF